jgi:hypothetical protein
MRCKKGQFYLITAILIIVLVVASATIYNYSRKKNSSTVYDLGEELGIESQNILDSGTFDSLNEEGKNSLLENFILDYVAYAGEGKHLYFIFGDKANLQTISYDGLVASGEALELTYSLSGNKVSVEVDSVVYEFDLADGHGFYFVVTQEIDEEKYVATNE